MEQTENKAYPKLYALRSLDRAIESIEAALDDYRRGRLYQAISHSYYALEDVVRILKGDCDPYERFAMFERALFNPKEPAVLLKVFSKEEVKECLKRIPVEQRFEHLARRVKLWRNLFLGENHDVPGTRWRLQ